MLYYLYSYTGWRCVELSTVQEKKTISGRRFDRFSSNITIDRRSANISPRAFKVHFYILYTSLVLACLAFYSGIIPPAVTCSRGKKNEIKKRRETKISYGYRESNDDRSVISLSARISIFLEKH